MPAPDLDDVLAQAAQASASLKAALNAANIELESVKTTAKEEAEKHKSHLRRMQKQRDTAVGQCEKLRKQIAELQDEVKRLKDDVPARMSEQEHRRLQDRERALQEGKGQLRRDREALDKTLTRSIRAMQRIAKPRDPEDVIDSGPKRIIVAKRPPMVDLTKDGTSSPDPENTIHASGSSSTTLGKRKAENNDELPAEKDVASQSPPPRKRAGRMTEADYRNALPPLVMKSILAKRNLRIKKGPGCKKCHSNSEPCVSWEKDSTTNRSCLRCRIRKERCEAEAAKFSRKTEPFIAFTTQNNLRSVLSSRFIFDVSAVSQKVFNPSCLLSYLLSVIRMFPCLVIVTVSCFELTLQFSPMCPMFA
ncbi:hypothetical protein R3P38DRAFT_3351126 [Favolaschia claudopus]|uniref:Zn(2)-C6 fungal-type domain-containing protein n=1 Tax=Favolaschia claudopus TaxID=2862362 RepID=A0AAW0CBH8_9AGAR